MRSTPLTRRDLLLQAAAMLGGCGLTARAIAGSCVAPDGADASLRESLHYVVSSPDAAQRCSACAFFSDPSGSCGKCSIFNSATDASGHCDSWAARS